MNRLLFSKHLLNRSSLLAAGSLPVMSAAWAGEAARGKEPASLPDAPPASAENINWLTGENASLGGVLFPHLHFQSVYGRTSSGLGHELGAGHHDPVRDGWTVQGFEAGVSARAGEYFEAFGTYHGFWENEDPRDYDGEFEEWFGKIKNLPGGFELRGGKYKNRFGFHNATHLHAWDWLDNYLIHGRLLGDDGLATIGGEVAWTLPAPWTSVLSMSVGRAQHEAHAHGHEHGHEHGHDDGQAENFYEGEGAAFDGTVATADWTHLWNYNDFHQFRGGVSGAWGDNTWGRATQVYGLHFQYEWRQNGLEPGGAYIRWRTEALFRRFDARAEAEAHAHEHEHHEEHGHEEEEHGHEEHREEEKHHGRPREASFDDWGFYTSLSGGHPLGQSLLEACLRYEYVSGLGEAGLAERWRVSPALTWFANANRTLFIRAQYNHDNIQGHGAEDSAWIGFGFNWGGAEVR